MRIEKALSIDIGRRVRRCVVPLEECICHAISFPKSCHLSAILVSTGGAAVMHDIMISLIMQ